MAKLDHRVKRFIVQSLACFDTPSQVAAAVKEEFGIEIGRQQVSCYDPTKAQGRNLSKELRELFEQTRQRFKTEIDEIPIANQSYRLRTLNRLIQQAEARGNAPLVAQLLEQAAKEVGGAFTNARRVEASGPGGGPIEHKHTTELSDDDLARIAASGSA